MCWWHDRNWSVRLSLTMEEGIQKPRKAGSLWKLGRETKQISPTGQGEGTQPCWHVFVVHRNACQASDLCDRKIIRLHCSQYLLFWSFIAEAMKNQYININWRMRMLGVKVYREKKAASGQTRKWVKKQALAFCFSPLTWTYRATRGLQRTRTMVVGKTWSKKCSLEGRKSFMTSWEEMKDWGIQNGTHVGLRITGKLVRRKHQEKNSHL